MNRHMPMDDAEFEARMARIRVSPAEDRGRVGVHVQVRPAEPDDEFDHGDVTFLTCDEDGLPVLIEDNRLDHHPDGRADTHHGHGPRHSLVHWLSGRWAWETCNPSEPCPQDTAKALARLRPDIAMAVSDAGFPPVFREAIAIVGTWCTGPYSNVAGLFRDDEEGERLRAYVRANPFLSEVTYRNLAWQPGDDGKAPKPLPEIPEDVLARFRVAPWTDPEAQERLMAELGDGDAHYRQRIVDCLPGLTADTVPSDYEGMRALCRLLSWAAGSRSAPWRLDPVALVKGVTDWTGVERRTGELMRKHWERDWLEGLYTETLGQVSDAFAERVLLPLRARMGTLQGFAGDEVKPELRRTAMAILYGGRNFHGCLDVLRNQEAVLDAVRALTPEEGVPGGRSWPALFPAARRDGFVLRCLASEAEIAAAGYRRKDFDGPSVRALASGGWVHVVAVDAFTETGAQRQVARAVVHWSAGRWDDVEGVPEYAEPTEDEAAAAMRDRWPSWSYTMQPTPEASKGLQALKAHLATLPDAPRPAYEPIASGEMVQDLCGYDWRDTAFLARVIDLFRPVLPAGLADLPTVKEALRQADMGRKAPSRSRGGHPGYRSFKFRQEARRDRGDADDE